MFLKRRFSKIKKFVTRSVFGELQLTQISLNFKDFLLQLKNQRSENKKVCRFSKESMHFVDQKYKF